MIYEIKNEPLLKRVPTFIDRTLGIQRYDLDNLYPQRADEVKNRSYTVGAAVERLGEFLAGEGFVDPLLASLIINDEGETANDLLTLISQDKSEFRGFALHFSYNLNYRIHAVTFIEFPFARFGLPDQEGNVFEIKTNNNWERDPYKSINRGWTIETYPVFNPDPMVVKAQIEHYGFESYPGQVLLWTPKKNIYPKCSFDRVFDQAQTQAESAVFDLSSVQNGFTASTVFKYPGTFTDDDDRLKFERKLSQHKGAKGAKSTLVVENPGGEELNLVETIQMQNTDKMFEGTDKRSRTAIRENYAMPMEVLGVTPESGMFNKESIQQAFAYYNAMTGGERTQISRVLQKVLSFWRDPIQVRDFTIKPKVYVG